MTASRLPSWSRWSLRADRDRHERAQLEALGAHAARAQPVAQRAGDDGSTTSLTVPPNAFLTSLKSVELAAHEREPPVRADRRRSAASSGAGFSPAQTTSPRPSTASRAASSGVRGPRRGAERAAGELERQLRPARARRARPASSALGSGCGAHGSPSCGDRLRHRRRGRTARSIEVDAGDAVDQRVVGLGDQREAAVLEALRRATAPTAAWSGRAAGSGCARRARAAAPRSPAPAARCGGRGTRG